MVVASVVVRGEGNTWAGGVEAFDMVKGREWSPYFQYRNTSTKDGRRASHA